MTDRLSDEQFVELWERHGSVSALSAATGRDISSIAKRRRQLRLRGIELKTRPAAGYESRTPPDYHDPRWTFPREGRLSLDTGVCVVFSDAHYWPGEPSTAHSALLAVIRKVRPRVVIANGDVLDGVSVSRHAPFGWSHRPKLREELDACIERLAEIEQAVPNGCELLWNVGNHCIRFERHLAQHAPEYDAIEGSRLSDHFPAWQHRWSTPINFDGPHPVMVKHRFQSSGIHAGYNATLKSGVSTVSGHTHLLEVKTWGDYRGRRFGVQTGTLADLHGPQFEYHENNPSPACSGFAILTFRDGDMLSPELCEVIRGRAFFRGEIVA